MTGTASHATVVVLPTRADTIDLSTVREGCRERGLRLAGLAGVAVPSLVAVLDELRDAGVPQIRLVVLSRAPRSSRSWVSRIASHWLRSRGHEQMPAVVIAPTAATDLATIDDLQSLPWRRIASTEAPLECAQWDVPPPHWHHILACRGPRCSAKGAEAVERALAQELARRGLLDDGILLTETGCLFPCNQAPVVVIHPEDIWCGHVTPDEVPTLLDEHTAAQPRTATP